MYLLFWMFVGGFIGWVASILTGNDVRMGIFLNITVGFIGSFIGGILAYLLEIGPLSIFSFGGMLLSLAGSVSFLIFINFFNGRPI